MKKLIKLSIIASTLILSTTTLQASSYGLEGDISVGRTTQPNMFGAVSYGNPAEVGIQQNIKLSTIKNRDKVAQHKKECISKGNQLEDEYKDVSGFFSKAKEDDKDGVKFDKRKTEYNLKKEAQENECISSEIYNDFGIQILGFGVTLEKGDFDNVDLNIKKYKVNQSISSTSEVDSYKNNVNDFLATLKDDLTISTNIFINVLSPVVFRLDSGTYSVGLGAKGAVNASLFGGKIDVDSVKLQKLEDDINNDPNYLEEHPEAASGVLDMKGTNFYIKDAIIANAYLGYANDFYQNDNGVLNIGGRLNFYKFELGKSRLDFRKYLKDALIGEDTTGNISDDVSDNDEDDRVSKKSSAVGLDLGVAWQTNNYNIGLYLANVNQPKADKPVLEEDTDRSTTYTMEMVPTITGAYFDDNNRWRLAFSYDTKEVISPVGEEYKWLSINAGYSSRVHRDSWWKYLIPDWRIGMNQNLAGTKITYYSAGIGLFGLNIDAMFDKRYLTDSDEAKGVGLSVSWGMNF